MIEIPETEEALTPLLTTIPFQLLSYHIAVMLDKNVDQPRNLAKSGYSGVVARDNYSYSYKLLVTFSISIRTTHLMEFSIFGIFRQYLFNRIRGLKEHFLTPIGYRKISQIFNEEGLRTNRNSVFTNSIVHSIYKKGKIREERVNREDIVEVSQPTIEVLQIQIGGGS